MTTPEPVKWDCCKECTKPLGGKLQCIWSACPCHQPTPNCSECQFEPINGHAQTCSKYVEWKWRPTPPSEPKVKCHMHVAEGVPQKCCIEECTKPNIYPLGLTTPSLSLEGEDRESDFEQQCGSYMLEGQKVKGKLYRDLEHWANLKAMIKHLLTSTRENERRLIAEKIKALDKFITPHECKKSYHRSCILEDEHGWHQACKELLNLLAPSKEIK